MSGLYARAMRAAIALGVFVAATAPAAAGPAASTLTLKAPGATTFGHVVDFAGRLSPTAPGTRVSLMRGKTVVAAMAIKRDGTYRFQVELGRPGPFHTVAAGVSSRPVLVRIVPELRTKLVGSRVVGTPLTLVARLQPNEAGDVRVRVVRDGSYAYRGSFAGGRASAWGHRHRRRSRLPWTCCRRRDTATSGRGSALPSGRPASLRLPGARSSRRCSTGCASSATPRRHPRTVFDYDAQQAVYAFQKAQRLERTGVADAAFWQRLARPAEIVPRYRFPASHIEIDKTRQILMVVRNGRPVLISPVSTAGIAGYFTPLGRFAIGRKVPGYDPSPLGVLYKPMYFYGGYAIHGSPSIPPYPASHGCVRVPNFVADRLYESEPYGEAVIVY